MHGGLLVDMAVSRATLARVTAKSTMKVAAAAIADRFARYVLRTTAAGSFEVC